MDNAFIERVQKYMTNNIYKDVADSLIPRLILGLDLICYYRDIDNNIFELKISKITYEESENIINKDEFLKILKLKGIGYDTVIVTYKYQQITKKEYEKNRILGVDISYYDSIVEPIIK